MYRVAWESLLTGALDHGEYCLDKTTAESWVKYLNEKYEGKINHWIEGPSS